MSAFMWLRQWLYKNHNSFSIHLLMENPTVPSLGSYKQAVMHVFVEVFLGHTFSVLGKYLGVELPDCRIGVRLTL